MSDTPNQNDAGKEKSQSTAAATDAKRSCAPNVGTVLQPVRS